MDDHLQAISRVYGPETWEVYERLDRSLDPRGPEILLDLAASYLSADSVLLDAGCRDGSHLIELVRRTGATGVGIDPVDRFVGQARAAAAKSGLEVEFVRAAMQDIPYRDAHFDVVWCRDVIEVVSGLEEALAEVARVLRPSGRLVLYTVFATDRLEPKDAALLAQNLTLVPANLVRANVEAAFAGAGLVVEREEAVGTEWREHDEERTQRVSRDLLRLARLRRRRDELIEDIGAELYAHVESNLHWLVWHFLGKLEPAIYVLGKPA